MNDNNSWIKLYRKFEEWEWFHISEMVHLFINLLIKANNKDRKWRGILIKRGQLITGRIQLSQDTGISEQSIRTYLERLKSTSEITIKSTNKYSIITILKYDDYQVIPIETNQQINQQTNQQLTSNQPATNQQLTTTKEDKKKDNKKDIIDTIEVPSMVRTKNPLLDSEIEKKSPPIKLAKTIDVEKELVKIYAQEHGDYPMLSMSKDKVLMRKLLTEFKRRNPNVSYQETLDGMRNHFRQCLDITDSWYHDHMSIGLMVSKFSEINKILKNGTTGKNKRGATAEEIAEAFAEQFATDIGGDSQQHIEN